MSAMNLNTAIAALRSAALAMDNVSKAIDAAAIAMESLLPGDSVGETIPGTVTDRAGPADAVSLADRMFPGTPESPRWSLLGEDITSPRPTAGGNDGGPVNRSDARSRSPKPQLRDRTVIEVLDASDSNFVESRGY